MTKNPYDLVLANGHSGDGKILDIGIADGFIVTLAPANSLAGACLINLGGALVLPGFIDGHIHLDKTFFGLPWMPHVPGGSVRERIAAERMLRRVIAEPMRIRARRLIDHVVAQGTLSMRSHVDIDEDVNLTHLEALLSLRDEVKGLVDIELVAFPQSGVASLPRATELLDAALAAGADRLGGLDPAGIDGDIEGQLRILFRLAVKHGVGLDIHLHDPGEVGAHELRRVAERTRAEGLEGNVAVSHAFALGGVPDAVFSATADLLARCGVAIMTNGPGANPRPPVRRLIEAGVTVFAGSDNIRDAWSPYGNGDMLQRAGHIGYLNDLREDAGLELAFALITRNAALALRIVDHGLAKGKRADLVVVSAETIAEAVATAPPRNLVIKAGKIVARDGQLAVP